MLSFEPLHDVCVSCLSFEVFLQNLLEIGAVVLVVVSLLVLVKVSFELSDLLRGQLEDALHFAHGVAGYTAHLCNFIVGAHGIIVLGDF